MRVTALAFPKPDARLFLPAPVVNGLMPNTSEKNDLSRAFWAAASDACRLFSALKTMTSPIFVSQYYN